MQNYSKLSELEKVIRMEFNDKNLLKNAFIHRSYLNEHKKFKGTSNERLEFLGDSVLSITVSRFLFDQLPNSSEGELTRLRAALVRTETLAKVAQKLKLGNYLYLSKGEEDSKGRTNDSTLANTFEALLGAIYLDQSPQIVQDFVKKNILIKWKDLSENAVSDHKSKFQELLQRQYHKSPTYKLTKSWGPDHLRQFEMAAYLDEKILGVGNGRNKQTAAQNAAQNAIQNLKKQKIT